LRDALSYKADKQDVKKDVNRLDALIEELRQSISSFLDKQNNLSKEVDRLGQFVEMLSKTMNSLRNQQTVHAQPAQNSGIDEGALREIAERLANLENQLMDFKAEFQRWIKDIQDALN
jgi:archaellum component FlaC